MSRFSGLKEAKWGLQPARLQSRERRRVLRSFLVNCTGTLAECVSEQAGCITQKMEERKQLLFTARICSLEGLSILFLYSALQKPLAGMPMFSLTKFLISLLGLNTVSLQSLPDDFCNQASQSLITATLQQLQMDTQLYKMAESPWIQPMLKTSMEELLSALLHLTHLCGHALTNPERKFLGSAQLCHCSKYILHCVGHKRCV